MKHINLDDCDESVKRFILSLAPDAGGSVLEVGGRAVACVLPVPATAEVADDWNPVNDERRCELIDREIAGTLTPEEAAELAVLQATMLRYRRRIAPLPLDDARQLHRELLAKVAGAKA
jgi:hypothetical protein